MPESGAVMITDLIYLGLTLACFILCALYVRGCETL